MKYWESFLQEAEYNNKEKPIQAILKPFFVTRYLFLTRFPFLIKKTIPGRVKLFFNRTIRGEFPDPVFSFLWLHKFNEEDLTFALLKYLKPGMVFLDVGAHIGYFSMLASFLVGIKGEVHAFEVTPRTFNMLNINVRDLGNVKTNLKAVWSKVKIITFRDYGPFYAPCNSYTKGKIAPHILKKLTPKLWKTKSITLDEYCKINKVKPDFVKIDVESAEYEVLLGMMKIIKKYKPIISVEVGDLDQVNINSSRRNIELLTDLGYKAFNFSNSRMVEHRLRDDYRSMFGNVVFIHKQYDKKAG